MKKRLAIVAVLSAVNVAFPFATAAAEECCGEVYSTAAEMVVETTTEVIADQVVYDFVSEEASVVSDYVYESPVLENSVTEFPVIEFPVTEFPVIEEVVHESPEFFSGDVVESVTFENETIASDACECGYSEAVIYEQ